MPGKILGSLAYMSPEQALGSKDISPASDVYSLGCILYQMLTGKILFHPKGKSQKEILYEIASHIPFLLDAFPSDVPASLHKICQKALEKKQQDRYQSAQEFSLDLKSLLPANLPLPDLPSLDIELEQKTQSTGFIPQTDSFSHFVLEKELGRGGMGIVYLARETQTSRKVALKILAKTEQTKNKARFLQEVRVLANLQHPNIVCLYEAGDTPELFFTMEYIEGQSLCYSVPKTKAKIQEGAVLFLKLAKALSFAHSQGIVHRDIKPANILVTKEGEPKIMDFGLAKVLQENQGLSQSKDILGTLLYMPPEQANGGMIDARADVYSLGATFYEFFTGHPPFSGKTSLQVLKDIFHKQPVPLQKFNSRIHREIQAIVLQCLAKDPAHRYSSAMLLSQDLENFLEGKPIQAKPCGSIQKTILWARRNPLASALLFFISLCLVLSLLALQKLWDAQRLWEENQKNLLSLHYKQGCTLFHQKKWDKALECFENGLKSKKDFQSYWMIACCYFLLEKPDICQQNLQKAIEVSPQEYPQLLLLQSLCYAEQKKTDKARETWKAAQKKFFHQAKAWDVFWEEQCQKQVQKLAFRMPLPDEPLEDRKARFFLLLPFLPVEEKQQSLWSIAREGKEQDLQEEFYKIGSLLYHAESGWQKELSHHVSPLVLKEIMLYAKGKWIFNMASLYWTRVSPKTQAHYASLYQKYYAMQIQSPVQKTFIEKKGEFNMVLIPPGQFLMGRPFSQEGDGPVLQVLVAEPYWIGESEITQKQWQSITGTTPWIKNQDKPEKHILLHDQAPATYICSERMEVEFLPLLGKEYALPDDVQWEYACRAGTTSLGFWGQESPHAYMWYKENTSSSKDIETFLLQKAGQKLPNPWNLFDMAGNAVEVCKNSFFSYSWFAETKGEYSFETLYAWDKTRIYRGGNIGSNLDECYSCTRGEMLMDHDNPVLGFRLVRVYKSNP